jgi:hypothetical protein
VCTRRIFSYHYEYQQGAGALQASPDIALWLYDLWVCAAAAGCLAYNVKLVSSPVHGSHTALTGRC